MSVLALVVIYGNLAVTFQPRKLGLPKLPGLPRPFAIHDAFLIPGMFSGYTPFNFDFFIEGQGQLDTPFFALRIEEHFPLRHAITYTQLFAVRHWDMLGSSGQRAAWRELADKIKARHNRLHPDRKIARLRFGAVTFPQHTAGYRAGKTAESSWRYIWYAEP
jgi:hypothetical protein